MNLFISSPLNMKNLIVLLVTYLISILQLNAQPANDDCSGAITLTNLVNWCSSNGAYTNVNATQTLASSPTCWTGSIPDKDVWFKFTAIGTAVNISVDGTNGGGSLFKPQIAVFTGTCSPFSMFELGCTEFTTTNTGYASMYLAGLSIGQEYYIVVDGYNTNAGTFKLCLNNFDPPTAPGQDCTTGAFLCNKNTITQQSLFGAGVFETAGTCLDDPFTGPTDKNSVWFKWTCATAGTITFSIDPLIPLDDIDWVFYELPSGNCASRINLRCNSSSCVGATGLMTGATNISIDPGCNGITNELWCSPVNMVAGKTYGLLVNNWTDASVGLNNGFTLIFGGTGTFVGPVSDFTISPAPPYCIGQNITFTDASTGGPINFAWSFGSGASIASANTVGPHTVSYATPGIKTIVLTADNGTCNDVSYQTIEILDCCVPPTIQQQPLSVSICSQNSTTFSVTATGAGTLAYQWQFNNVDIPGANSSTYTISPIDAADAGNYTCIVSDGNCSDTTDIAILSFGQASAVDFSATPLDGCTPLSVQFTDLSAGTIVDWHWDFGDPSSSNNNSNNQNPIHVYNNGGSYTVTLEVTNDQGCVSSLTMNNLINPSASPVASFICNPDVAFEDEPTVNFINTSSGGSIYLWEFDDGSAASTENSPSHTFPGTETYVVWLYVENDAGCRDSVSNDVTIYPLFTCFVPNSFSPNGDGVNDLFVPYGAGWDLKTYLLIIYDRWGQEVFRSSDINNAWDGSLNGKLIQTQSVFRYSLMLEEYAGIVHQYYGTVLLLK